MELISLIDTPVGKSRRHATAIENELASPLHVLLVEDDAEAAWLVQTGLELADGEGFRVDWRYNLKDAMERLAHPGIDVVLLDLGMPELDGYKSFRAIESAAGKLIPVVILTADDSRLSQDLTLGFGASDYLVKGTVSNARLGEALRDAVRNGRPWTNETGWE